MNTPSISAMINIVIGILLLFLLAYVTFGERNGKPVKKS